MKLKSALAALAVLTVAALPAFAEATWLTNFEEAKALAIKEGKPLLLDFTGSDWCPPCKALHKEVFSTEEFAKEATAKYVLVELDFPRSKPLAPELKAQNAGLQKKYEITGYPTVLLVDPKTGEVFGRSVGFGGLNARGYLDKLASFKNTPEGKAALAEEAKKSAEMNAKRSAIYARVKAAVDAKDFAAASAAYDEMYVDAPARSRVNLNMNKASVSMRIDPKDTARALKFIDAALVDAASDEALATNIKGYRAKIVAGENPFAPKAVAPKAEGKPAVEAKKVEKGA